MFLVSTIAGMLVDRTIDLIRNWNVQKTDDTAFSGASQRNINPGCIGIDKRQSGVFTNMSYSKIIKNAFSFKKAF
jgi:hypothetical protein